jgi:hypothetical protein
VNRPSVATAFHEAAHAVVALAVGLPLAEVSITADAVSSGRVTLARSTATGGQPLNHAEKAMLHAVMVLFYLSGAAGGRLVGFETGAECDEEIAATFAADLDAPPHFWMPAAREAAARTVQANALAVGRIAEALLIEQVLSAARAREIAGVLIAPDLRNLAGGLDYAFAQAARAQRGTTPA